MVISTGAIGTQEFMLGEKSEIEMPYREFLYLRLCSTHLP